MGLAMGTRRSVNLCLLVLCPEPHGSQARNGLASAQGTRSLAWWRSRTVLVSPWGECIPDDVSAPLGRGAPRGLSRSQLSSFRPFVQRPPSPPFVIKVSTRAGWGFPYGPTCVRTCARSSEGRRREGSDYPVGVLSCRDESVVYPSRAPRGKGLGRRVRAEEDTSVCSGMEGAVSFLTHDTEFDVWQSSMRFYVGSARCDTRPHYGFSGGRAVFCVQHMEPGMVHILKEQLTREKSLR